MFLIKIYMFFTTIGNSLYGKKAIVLVVEPYKELFYYFLKSLLKIKSINFTNKILKYINKILEL
jgi:hypothetical protein